MKAKQKSEVLNNGTGRIAPAFVRHLTSLPSHSEEEKGFALHFFFKPSLVMLGKEK